VILARERDFDLVGREEQDVGLAGGDRGARLDVRLAHAQPAGQRAVGAVEVAQQDPALVAERDLQVRAADGGVRQNQIVDGTAADRDARPCDLDLRALIGPGRHSEHHPPQLRVAMRAREKSGGHPGIEVVVDLRDSSSEGLFGRIGHGNQPGSAGVNVKLS
jgi:hypothetical protein